MRRRPLVSVVVPTYRRPDRVPEAVGSALAQTRGDLEVVVVVDGGDEATLEALAGVRDERLCVVRPPRRLGNGGARNAGIDAARGSWIAFLDDDDRWEPEKLERQLEAAQRSPHRLPIVSASLRARDGVHSFVWPRRYPRPGEPLSEYLFCRRRPTTGEGLLQTSTLLVPLALARSVPFHARLRRFVDLDWVLRAGRVAGAGILFPEDRTPLVDWRIEGDRARVTNQVGWRWDVAWIRRRRALVTRRAYAAFLLTLPSARAAREGDRRALPFLLREAWRGGCPGAAEVAYHVGNFSVPRAWRGRLARALASGGGAAPEALAAER